MRRIVFRSARGGIVATNHLIIARRREWRTRPEASSPLWTAAFLGCWVFALSCDVRASDPIEDAEIRRIHIQRN